MSETTTEMLAEIDRDLADIEKAVHALQEQAAAANYPQPVETTTDRLAEIEGQAEPQPVQAREGRWRTRGGEVKYNKAGGSRRDNHYSWPWTDTLMCWQDNGFYHASKPSENDLVEYLGPIQPEPERIITPDDVAAEALAGVNEWPSVQTLRRQLETTEAALLEQQQRNEQLVTQGSQQRMQIQELRSEVNHVQRLWGESRRRAEELETLVTDLRAVNAATEPQLGPQPVHLQAMIEAQAETIARLNSEIHGLNMEIGGLQAQLEAVKAELVQASKDRQALQIELDAYELRSHNVSDRFEEGWDAGTARAVETIAEWLEPLRKLIDAADNVEETERASNLAADVMQNLPHIMRSLTGLTDED